MTHTGRRTEATAISQWLTSTTRHPEIAEQDWAAGRPAILRTGIIYDAIRMPMELVHAAVWSTVPNVVGGALAEVLDGPVVCHPGRWYYALVPPGTCEVWRSPVAVARGQAAITAVGFIPRPAMWVGPSDTSIPVAAGCEHSPPGPEGSCTGDCSNTGPN
ncbi:hypothetical protein [Streptomyces sp. NPDC088400]|uniref:hypothetical protein n=1 Tax=Streptomyces sp. NPDC088400 TaxID=3365861 RepID=UPI0038064FA1